MNPRQVLMQARYLLRNRNWSESGGTRVFPSVHVTILPTSKMRNLRRPMVLLRPGTEKPDSQRPGRGQFTVDFELGVGVAGDQVGENALLGANVADLAKSEGKGLFWTERELKAVIRQLETDDGIRVVARRTGAQRVVIERDAISEASKVYEVTFDVSDEPYYHPPLRLTASCPIAGTARLVWVDPPTRFDSRPTTPIMIRRAVGATAPATVTDGTLVTRLALGVQTYDDTGLAVATYSYALFAAYTDSLKDEEQSFSAQETGSTVTQVVT